MDDTNEHVDYICELIKERGGTVVWQKDGSVYFSFDLSEKYVMMDVNDVKYLQAEAGDSRTNSMDCVQGFSNMEQTLSAYDDQVSNLDSLNEQSESEDDYDSMSSLPD